MPEISEFAKRKLPYILLVGLLGAAGCGAGSKTVWHRSMQNLNCGANPNNEDPAIFPRMAAGELIILGHLSAKLSDGLVGDATVQFDKQGLITVTPNGRPDLTNAATPVITDIPNGKAVLTGDENYNITIKRETQPADLFEVTVVGECVDPKKAEALQSTGYPGLAGLPGLQDM